MSADLDGDFSVLFSADALRAILKDGGTSVKRKIMEDGNVIKLGDVVTFDHGRHCLIGKIIAMDEHPDGNEIDVTIIEPSGHKRIRSLIYDYNDGGLSVYPADEAKALTSRAWETWEAAQKR